MIAESSAIQVFSPSQPSNQIGEVEITPVKQIERAVDLATSAQADWNRLTASARADYLLKWANAIDAIKPEFAELISKEVGKPINESLGEVERASAILRYYAGEAIRTMGELIPAQVSKSFQLTVRKPLGVVGLISPWNFPIAIPLWKAAPALAFGNAVVIKPSEMSSLTAQKLQETAVVAGLPEGIYQTIFGSGPVGTALLDQPIQAISFTGSVATGHKIIEAAARKSIRCQAEMGGKNPTIVLADADLDLAAALTAGAAMRFAGQKCTASSRVIVDQSVAETFVAKLIAKVEELKVGDPLDPKNAVGPVISHAAQARINEFVGSVSEPLIYKGTVPSEGWYLAPSIFDHVDSNSKLAQTELFGPVLAITRVSGVQAAIEAANATPYGLSASLITKDLGSAMQYVNEIHAGMIRVNADTTGVDPYAPFGGCKSSSYGPREQGPAAREFFTETSTVQINY